MKVKELINELLELDMDATVDVDIETNEKEINTTEFTIHTDYGDYVTFIIKPNGYVLLSEDAYLGMKERITVLEDQLEDLK